jgi:hypothetical protein
MKPGNAGGEKGLSSGQTQRRSEGQEIGQPINSEKRSEAAECVTRESEDGSRVALLRHFWSIRKAYCRVARYWYKMLCRRSWRGRFTWEVFNHVLERFPLQHPQLRLTYGQLQSLAVL